VGDSSIWARQLQSTWLLGALVALLGWKVGMNAPSVGLDVSWNAGLTMAVKEGLQAGSDIVFSYGPLGFLQGQSIWYGDLALLAFFYSATLYVALCVALVWTLRRTLPLGPAVLVAFLVSVLPLLEQALVLPVLVCMGALAGERSERTVTWLAVGGASFGALEALVKLSTGPLVAVFFLIALIGLRARWWQILGFLALFGAEVVALWLIARQSLAGIPDFLESTLEVVSGYSEAMPRLVDVPAWQVDAATVAAALLAIGLVVLAARARYPDERARWAGTALIGVAAFATYKQGVVRADAGHLSLFFSTTCVLWIAIPWTRARWQWLLAGVVAIGIAGIPVRPPGPTGLNVVNNVRFAKDQLLTLVSASRRADLSAAGRESMKDIYRLGPQTLAALRGHSVAADPWEIGVVWAYGLDWSPLPVIQNYSAYTEHLDLLNAAAAESPEGPERILRENAGLVYPEFPTRSIDNRFPGWDPPAQARAILCHFVPLHTTERWQVLGRVPNRCSRPRLIRSVEAVSGEVLRVPAAGRDEVVFVSIEGVEVDGFERLLSVFLRAPARHVIVNGTRSYRLVPGTAADGLLLRGSERIGGSGAFAQIPGARTIEITGTSGDLRFDFFRVRVDDD
jgi:hypothetical protein